MFKEKPWTNLLLIPLQFLIDYILVIASGFIDSALYNPPPNSPGGMPFPLITFLMMIILAFITIIVIIISIIRTIKFSRAKRTKIG